MIDETATHDDGSHWLRAVSRIASTRPAGWLFVHVTTHLDRRLLPASGGRFSTAPGVPILCLEVAGRRSGKIRRVPVVYRRRGNDLVLVASAAGRPQNPDWFYNVCAADRVRVYARHGLSGEYSARVAEGAERDALWDLVLQDLPGFANYENLLGGKREIPVVVLSRAESKLI